MVETCGHVTVCYQVQLGAYYQVIVTILLK